MNLKNRFNKKATNQVEYITAMLLFIFALIVVMYFVLTYDIAERQDYLTTIENNFKEETGIIYSVFYFSGGTSVKLSDLPEYISDNKENLSIINNGEKVYHEFNNSFLNFSGDGGNYSFIISPDIEGVNGNLGNTPNSNPKFSLQENFSALYFEKIKNFKLIDYSNNYEELKQKISEGKEFAIGFQSIRGCDKSPYDIKSFEMTRYIPDNVQVSVGKFPAKVFVNADEICDVNVIIKIWEI